MKNGRLRIVEATGSILFCRNMIFLHLNMEFGFVVRVTINLASEPPLFHSFFHIGHLLFSNY
jgi:hypothetical protein